MDGELNQQELIGREYLCVKSLLASVLASAEIKEVSKDLRTGTTKTYQVLEGRLGLVPGAHTIRPDRHLPP